MLPSLKIQNFRCLENLTFNHLARVNLLVGRNNVGKSTVLEALRIYSENANIELLKEITKSHDEKYLSDDLTLNDSKPFENFFTIKTTPVNDYKKILIGEENNSISIQYVLTKVENDPSFINGVAVKIIEPKNHEDKNIPIRTFNSGFYNIPIGNTFYALSIRKEDKDSYHQFYIDYFDCKSNEKQRFYRNQKTLCSFIPTQFISTEKLEKEWDKINLTKDEEIVNQALQIISPTFCRLVFDGEHPNRWVKVKLSDLEKPVPLKSLGDGMLRILQIAIKLVSAQGGFLLIDEFENGLHYSVQEKVWDLLFKMAEQLDVQIFATTHSWDCVTSFRTVWEKEGNQEKGSFHRLFLHPTKNQIDVMPYDCETLDKSIERDIEVR